MPAALVSGTRNSLRAVLAAVTRARPRGAHQDAVGGMSPRLARPLAAHLPASVADLRRFALSGEVVTRRSHGERGLPGMIAFEGSSSLGFETVAI